MITADFAIVPVGTKDTECKEYVTSAVQVIKDSGLTYYFDNFFIKNCFL